VFVLVVAVTKVMILSTLFSLKEEQDHEEEGAARVTFVTLFFETQLRTANTENLKRGRVFSIPLAFLAEIEASGQLHAGRCPLLSRFDDLQRARCPNPGVRVRGCILIKKDAFLTKLRG
jgi:hypothetical protein